jgi:hypothetical protein
MDKDLIIDEIVDALEFTMDKRSLAVLAAMVMYGDAVKRCIDFKDAGVFLYGFPPYGSN